MIELEFRDFLAFVSGIVTIVSAYFFVKSRVASVADRVSNIEKKADNWDDARERLVRTETKLQSMENATDRIFRSLQRIENKIDGKADK